MDRRGAEQLGAGRILAPVLTSGGWMRLDAEDAAVKGAVADEAADEADEADEVGTGMNAGTEASGRRQSGAAGGGDTSRTEAIV